MRLLTTLGNIWAGGMLALAVAFITTDRVRLEFAAWSFGGVALGLAALYLSFQNERKIKRLRAYLAAELVERRNVARMKARPPRDQT